MKARDQPEAATPQSVAEPADEAPTDAHRIRRTHAKRPLPRDAAVAHRSAAIDAIDAIESVTHRIERIDRAPHHDERRSPALPSARATA